MAVSHALVVGSGIANGLHAQTAAPLLPPRQALQLQCRGGGSVVFDTLLPSGKEGRTRLAMTFAASARAAGPEGQALGPGTCAWVDRPLNQAEPRRIEFLLGTDDTTPERTVADSGMYWSFLAYNGDAGSLTGVGYRHWHDSSPPPLRPALIPAAPQVTQSRWKAGRFDLRYLPLLGVAVGAILGIPLLSLLARFSGWKRLAEMYPDRNAGHGRSFRSGRMVMNMSVYGAGVRFAPDESHLHFAMSGLTRPGHRPFSVPWSDVSISRDVWPWFPLEGYPMARIAIAADPHLRILVKERDGTRIIDGSGGQITLDESLPRDTMAFR
jgi:hypothetical protein